MTGESPPPPCEVETTVIPPSQVRKPRLKEIRQLFRVTKPVRSRASRLSTLIYIAICKYIIMEPYLTTIYLI